MERTEEIVRATWLIDVRPGDAPRRPARPPGNLKEVREMGLTMYDC